MPEPEAILIYANSEQCADLFYRTRFFAPDPYAFLETQSRKIILLNDLEIDRGRRVACVDEIDSLSEIANAGGVNNSGIKSQLELADILTLWLKKHSVSEARVPYDFPSGLLKQLESRGIKLVVASTELYPEREFKTAEELAAMRTAMRIAEAGMARGIEVLRAAEITKSGRLKWGGKPLTAEILRAEIDSAVLRRGGLAQGTIVACGEQACDPHERGSGPLRANQLIILDVFPRDTITGFYGDLTRTVVRGRATEPQRRLWETCLAGQKAALAEVKPGVVGLQIHDLLLKLFQEAGYPREIHNGRWRGFFHGTGHGLGLELHESPRFQATTLRAGQVFTIEPGIYWPGVGGVRHEDVIVVTENGYSLLSRFPKFLEI
jgi:Xaa-Pro aminopeptidase